jgi:uncharacterized protein (DUF169 family)
MEKLRRLEEKIGGRWSGVKFHRNGFPKDSLAKKPMRLCEAIKKSSCKPITLKKDLVNCPGALRSLGWEKNGDEEIARKITATTGAKPEIIKKLISATPFIDDDVEAVTVGIYDSPDVAVSYIQPCSAMQLIRQWQQANGDDLDVKVSSVMAACGNVVVRAYVSDKICLSFGCPDSREYGGIGNDRLVIGIPVHLLDELL